MKFNSSFLGQHDDFVHDVCYDYYGKRLATCSSDHKIKIWSQNGNGEWQCEAELSGHSGPVWKLSWAHPEFGSILASCSLDQHVFIWEEQDEPNASQENGAPYAHGKWNQVARLTGRDSRDSINDIKFAPPHLGLELAACGQDGVVRIWAAGDLMNLEAWQIKYTIDADEKGLTSISWNESQFDMPMLVVGSSSNAAKVWGYREQFGRWQVLNDLVGHEGSVNDVCWAPNLGRSYHLVATVSSDKKIKIWKLTKGADDAKFWYESQLCADLDDNAEVWRAEWNVTGTVLATSGDDGQVKLWRRNMQGNWVCVTEVSAETKAG